MGGSRPLLRYRVKLVVVMLEAGSNLVWLQPFKGTKTFGKPHKGIKAAARQHVTYSVRGPEEATRYTAAPAEGRRLDPIGVTGGVWAQTIIGDFSELNQR